QLPDQDPQAARALSRPRDLAGRNAARQGVLVACLARLAGAAFQRAGRATVGGIAGGPLPSAPAGARAKRQAALTRRRRTSRARRSLLAAAIAQRSRYPGPNFTEPSLYLSGPVDHQEAIMPAIFMPSFAVLAR